ncbi:hypothetical protein BJV74DRAFT_799140 [Russula compacta]|nr:hypothetical protein BJV74DRAFT_799140 [Russula compacta]
MATHVIDIRVRRWCRSNRMGKRTVGPAPHSGSADIVYQDYRDSVLTRVCPKLTCPPTARNKLYREIVEYIWKGRKGPAVYLFFLNRYLIPLSFMVNLWAYFRKSWSLTSCSHFVRYEGSMAMIGVTVVALMMFLRIRAMYSRFLSLQVFVLSILFTFIGINSWLLTRGIPVPHPAYPLVDSCTMIIDPKVPGALASSTAWLPLVYDTVVVFLTLNGTARFVRSQDTGKMFRTLLREGLLYYGVICSITLVFTIMITAAAPSVRNIAGQLQLCLTVAMMSRITIHLKRFGRRPNHDIHGDAKHRNPFIHQQQQHLLPPDQTETNTLPIFATPTVPSSQQVTFLLGPPTNGAPAAASGDESYLAMETFSTMTSGSGECQTQHLQEPARGTGYVVPGIG